MTEPTHQPDHPDLSSRRCPSLSRRTALGLGVAAATAGLSVTTGLPETSSATQAPPPAPVDDATPDASGSRSRRTRRRRRPTKGVQRPPDFADVAYVDDGDPLQVLDIYLPEGADNSTPVLVWIHGGGYMGGDKAAVGVPYLLDDGFAIVSINYRLLPEAPFPAQIADANAAISWVWDHADNYRFDRDRLVVGGSSAGGTSTVLVAVSQNDAVPEFAANPDVRIAAWVDFFGSTTAAQLETNPERRAGAIVGTDDNVADLLNSLQWVDRDDPPGLVVHGGLDRTVLIEQSELLVAALEDAGVPVTFARYPELGHGMRKFQFDEIQETVRSFLGDTLRR